MHHRRRPPPSKDGSFGAMNNCEAFEQVPNDLSGGTVKDTHPSTVTTWANAVLCVLSGCSQPLIITLCKDAGLADSGCQLYMFFYALGPALSIFPLLFGSTTSNKWPSVQTMSKAAGICLFDIVCTVANYTGGSLAGPTIFAIVYSSVTVWTALFSQIFLHRRLNPWQWVAIVTVFGGLTITATDSMQLGDDVALGLVLMLVGSAMHALTYIMSEAIMTISEEQLSVVQNNVIQSMVAAAMLGFWQVVYTYPRWDQRIRQPMNVAGTSNVQASKILLALAFVSWAHSFTFFHTLKYFPGGSTSAGVMKSLQAVLVFVVTHVTFCGRTGGPEMCFTRTKFLALLAVSGGVLGYGFASRYPSSRAAKAPAQRTRYVEPVTNGVMDGVMNGATKSTHAAHGDDHMA